MATNAAGGTGKASDKTTSANIGVGEDKPKVLDAQGAIGHAFTEEGVIGGTAEKVGGPLSKDGMIGKEFTTEGSIGGTVQSVAGGKSGKSN